MAVFRRRLIFWLIRAYLKKWGKVIAISFILGLIIFFLLLTTSSRLAHLIHFQRKTIVGIVGAFPPDAIPQSILSTISYGLTSLDKNGHVKPGVAQSWKIDEKGKRYTFLLKKNIHFTDGQLLTSKTVIYNFKDVSVSRPDDYTISYTLKSPYAPFLVTVSKPIFINNTVGIGTNRITSIELNGNFIKTIRISSIQDKLKTVDYQFYPNLEALKIAFALGEVNEADGLNDIAFDKTSFSKFPNTKITKAINHGVLVTLFYNTQDDELSDKKLRDALSYALPDTFTQGERASQSYAPNQWFFNTDLEAHLQDITHAKLLLASHETAANEKTLPILTIKTQPKYRSIAGRIAKDWQRLGIKVHIENTDTVPSNFQVYLADFNVPADPDQYSIWHSGEPNNIMRYKNLRIDKLLEDGRTQIDIETRKKTYGDFQKYLLDDAPAAFLYFPYSYTVSR